jgi:hypothetical protein
LTPFSAVLTRRDWFRSIVPENCTAEDAEAAQSTRCLRAHRAILRALCGEVSYLTVIVPLI